MLYSEKRSMPTSQQVTTRARSASADTTQTEMTTDSTAQSTASRVPKAPITEASRSIGTERVVEEDEEIVSPGKNRVKEIDMIPSIKAKIDEVPLSKVRNALFELVRYQFDFDNASFFRNRMFSALKTMSFAVASSGEFRKMLYESHTKYISTDAVADWIKFGLDMLWPDGVWMQSAPPLTAEEQEELSQKAKDELPKAFPDQLKSVLGQEIVLGGLDILHEMLQNRLVLKSMLYMMFDMLWLEAFPELHDFLTGAAALEAD
uniref:Sorting nexin C-terminal domain-containing protein n=1 Tax=Cyclophora tenuis TaxID=216820 RepID=A0A7S1GPC6_CYCTE|mmetsp:Transcript_3845/g.6571  ORF Transcript_3845/g.6571 Transcript_3845/m.6571 type:complete len:262 (+) Transcript_3845:3-788(+)